MRIKRLIIGLVCTVAVVSAAPARSAGLEYSLTPFLWGTGITGSVNLGTISGDFDVGFSDIMDNLEMAVPIHFEAKGPVWTLIAELNYVGLGQEMGDISGEGDLDMLMFEFLSGWEFRPNWDLIFGARYTDMDVKLTFFAPPTGGTDTVFDEGQSWVDPVLGIRWSGQMNRRGTWHASTRFDAGGFGLGSDLTLNARVIVGRDLSQTTRLWFGYHVLDTEYDRNGFLYDVTQQGPEIGVGFRW
jgi:hypothetical protein